MSPQIKINIILQSYNYYYLKKTISHLSNTLQSWGLNLTNFTYISLPRRKQVITVLKSPHIHKKAREQFELSTAKASMQIVTHSKKDAILILFLIHHSTFPGVETKYKIKYRTIM